MSEEETEDRGHYHHPFIDHTVGLMNEPPTTAAPPMRTWEEIQYAHDVLAEIAESPAAFTAMPKAVQIAVLTVGSALCWVLGHEVGDEGFVILLRTILPYLKRSRELLEQVEQQLEPEETN
jgi:hypothetical protein